LIRSDIAEARAMAKKTNSPPREAWQLECVQEDHTNPLPCTAEEAALYSGSSSTRPTEPSSDETGKAAVEGSTETVDDDLFRQMMGGEPAGATKAPSSDEDLFREMMGDKAGGSAPKDPTPAEKPTSEEDLFRQMMGAGADSGAPAP